MEESIRAELRRQGGQAVLHPRSGSKWAVTLRWNVSGADRATLWEWITQPRRLARWSPVVPDRPLIRVGPAFAREGDGAPVLDAGVLQVHEYNTLRHRWGGDDLTLQIEDSNGSWLTIEDQVTDRAEAADMACTWDISMAVLVCLLRGEEVPRVVGAAARGRDWDALHSVYTTAWEQPDND